MNKTIKQLFQDHKGKMSDKWSLYLDEWDRLFKPFRFQKINLLEIGIQNGGSLEIWSKYFLGAGKIVGCDIDEQCRHLRFDDTRIAIVIDDVNSDVCEHTILQQVQTFDIIIDDGSHKSSDIVRSFARYFRHLNEDGIYLVEDLHASYWNSFEGGLRNPLSAMSFFKRVSDLVNFEHWRNNKPRGSLLTEFSTKFGISFNEFDLTRIHSIEIINSLCIIKKMPPEKNVLGKRIVVGKEQDVTSGWEDLNGAVIQDHQTEIIDDGNLDVFELLTNIQNLNTDISEKEQAMHALSAQVAKMDQAVEALSARVAERDQSMQALSAQVAEKEQSIQALSARVAERDQSVQVLASQVTEKDQSLQALSVRVAELEQSVQFLAAQLAEKELSVQALSVQLAEKNQSILTLTALLAEKEQYLQALLAQVEEKEQSIQAVNARWRELSNSKAWRAIMVLRRLHDWLVPPWSLRSRFLEDIFSIILFPFNIRKNWRILKYLNLIRSSDLFDKHWYLRNNPDVFQARVDPARHYLHYGGFEGRDPGPNFSSKRYLEVYPDVAAAGINPLLHYLKFGKIEGRVLQRNILPEQSKVGVVIVSHNASLAVRVTLASLCRAKNIAPYEVMLVDNGSDQTERDIIYGAFKKHVDDENLPWHYVQLEENLGFAGGNNIGIEMFLKDDTISHICMLNSDVIVPDFWLDRLVREECDVISPVTNKSESVQVVPADYDVDLMSSLDSNKEILNQSTFEKVNAFAQDWFRAWQGNIVFTEEDVTFFCVLLTKNLVRKVGLLDTQFFPGGYEDYDYCARVRAIDGKIFLARDVYIHHWGSASFGQLPRDYFNKNAIRNRSYLEEKYKITWKRCPQAPVMSYAQDVAYALARKGIHSIQHRWMNLYNEKLMELFAHYEKEFIALERLVRNCNRNIPRELEQEIEKVALETGIEDDWSNLSQEIGAMVGTLLSGLSQVTSIEQKLTWLGARVYDIATCNINMSEFLYGLHSPQDKGQIAPRMKGLRRIFFVLRKGLPFFWKLNGVVIFGGYPYPEREKDGYYQRIRGVDTLLSNQWRIYFDQGGFPGRVNWYDRPEPKVLVFRGGNGQDRKRVARFCVLLCVLRCRAIYFHSILAMRGPSFLMRLPGITKIIDIHGVVPEEFRYHDDFVNADFYEQFEKLAIRKTNLIIVVSDAMRYHLQKKYLWSVNRKYVVLPIIPEINADHSKKAYIKGKPVVIYAGGLQKWQQVPKMIDAISKTIDICLHKFYCPKPEEFRAMLSEGVLNNPHLLIESKSYSDLLVIYPECHFGLALREDIIVNRVACPTKIVEYIAMGIVPILESADIGDFKSMGLQFVPLQGFLDGNLPNEATRNRMAQSNFAIFEKLREQYLTGSLILQKTLKIGGGHTVKSGRKGEIFPCMANVGADARGVSLVEESRQVPRLAVISDSKNVMFPCDILVQVGNFLSGGLENVVLNVNEALIGAGWRVGLLVLGEAGEAVKRARSLGMPVLVAHIDSGEYERLLKVASPKVVISHYSVQGAKICSKLSIPFVQVIHNMYMWFTDDQKEEFREAAKHTIAFIACSEIVKGYSLSRLGVPSEKCFVIPNGIDIQEIENLNFEAERNRLRSKYGFSDSDFVFLNVAAITHQKNHLGAVKAFHSAFAKCPQVKLVIVGPIFEKSLYEELQAYIWEHKIRDRVTLAGASSQVLGYYAMADALISSSFFEGGQLTLLEALAANLPIVTSEVGFAPLFRDRKGIALVPPPVDIINFHGSILQLHSTVEFERSLASQMEMTYHKRIKPDLEKSLIKRMDKSHSYKLYVKFIKQIILSCKISTTTFIDSWPNHVDNSPKNH